MLYYFSNWQDQQPPLYLATIKNHPFSHLPLMDFDNCLQCIYRFQNGHKSWESKGEVLQDKSYLQVECFRVFYEREAASKISCNYQVRLCREYLGRIFKVITSELSKLVIVDCTFQVKQLQNLNSFFQNGFYLVLKHHLLLYLHRSYLFIRLIFPPQFIFQSQQNKCSLFQKCQILVL